MIEENRIHCKIEIKESPKGFKILTKGKNCRRLIETELFKHIEFMEDFD